MAGQLSVRREPWDFGTGRVDASPWGTGEQGREETDTRALAFWSPARQGQRMAAGSDPHAPPRQHAQVLRVTKGSLGETLSAAEPVSARRERGGSQRVLPCAESLVALLLCFSKIQITTSILEIVN